MRRQHLRTRDSRSKVACAMMARWSRSKAIFAGAQTCSKFARGAESKAYVGFAMDCCNREILAYVAEPRHLDGANIRSLIAKAVEARFDDVRTPAPVEWLSDNGPPYTAFETNKFGRDNSTVGTA